MGKNEPEGCVKPAAGPLIDVSDPSANAAEHPAKQEVADMTVTVGAKAPDFEANAFYGGAFQTIKLSDFKGKWVLLCFYPGDFTFV